MKLRFHAMETFALLLCVLYAFTGSAYAADKPNILVIMGDDIGYWIIVG